MKEINLNNNRVALVDDADYEALNAHKWYAWKSPSGIWYARRNMYSKEKTSGILMHQQIMATKGTCNEVDHENHDGLDNQRKNLRICTRKQNVRNSRKHRDSYNLYKGAWKHGNKWRARIMVDGKNIHLGYFLKENEAAEAYKTAALKYFGDFACTDV